MAFATVDDVAARLEESALSGGAQDAATQLLATATAVICDAVDEVDEDWFTDLSTVNKALVKGLTIELVCRGLASPQGIEKAVEVLGAYSREETYRRDLSTAVLLTAPERTLIRRVALGSPLISPRTPPIDDSYYPPELDPFFLGS